MDPAPDFADERPRFAWTITADHLTDRFPDDLKFAIVSLAGIVGPEGCDLTSEEIAGHPDAALFRISDDIGLIYEGSLLGEVGDLSGTIPGTTEPWHSICSGWPRTVELFRRGRWQRGEYQGMFHDDWTPFGL